jgi:hypothetical protein
LADDGFFTKALEIIGDLLPAKLRAPFASGIALLLGVGAAILFFLHLEWNDIFETWQFLLALCILLLIWSIILILRRKSITWPHWVSWLVAVLLLFVIVALASPTVERSHYQYNQDGFFESRSLRPPHEGGHSSFEWAMEVVGDNLSKGRVIVGLQPIGDCKDENVTAFYPVKSENTHQPKVWDISSLGGPHSVWGIDDLHDGDEVRFILESPETDVSRICLKPRVTVQTK